MKKVFAIALLLCLVLGAAFAAKGKAEVGAQLGYGNEFTQIEYNTKPVGSGAAVDEKTVYTQGAFYFAATGAYGITEDVALKAEFGINTMGKMKSQVSVNGENSPVLTADDPTPINFNLYLGAEYEIDFTKELSLCTGLGVDMMFGKETGLSNDESNGRIGIGFELVGKYAINKNIKINLGGKFAVHFLNTGDKTKAFFPAQIKAGQDWLDVPVVGVSRSFSHFQGGFEVFAGATYVL